MFSNDKDMWKFLILASFLTGGIGFLLGGLAMLIVDCINFDKPIKQEHMEDWRNDPKLNKELDK